MRIVSFLLLFLLHLQLPSASLFSAATGTYINTTHQPHANRQLQTQSAYYTVREIDRQSHPTSPADIQIQILNANPLKWYSVTVVSPGKYTGTANFLQDRPNNTTLLYSWIPKFRGEYEIIVHELDSSGRNQLLGLTPPLKGEYKFSVEDKPPYDSYEWIKNEIRRVPPCHTVERRDLYTVWDGSWIGPGLYGENKGMRTGWYFLPSKDMSCKIEYFTEEELSWNREERSIYILGSSKGEFDVLGLPNCVMFVIDALFASTDFYPRISMFITNIIISNCTFCCKTTISNHQNEAYFYPC